MMVPWMSSEDLCDGIRSMDPGGQQVLSRVADIVRDSFGGIMYKSTECLKPCSLVSAHAVHRLSRYLGYRDNTGTKYRGLLIKSVFFLTQKLTKILEQSGNNSDPSRVINVGSIDGIGIPRAETYSYPASKAAVHQLTRVLANRLAHRNININAIAYYCFLYMSEIEMYAFLMGTIFHLRKETVLF